MGQRRSWEHKERQTSSALPELKKEKKKLCSQKPGSVQFGVGAEIFKSPFTAAEVFVLLDKYFQGN